MELNKLQRSVRLKLILGIILLITCVNVNGLMAGNGSWTRNEFFYKPALGARGVNEKALFDEGLDRIDTRLGKIKYVTDHKYGAVGDGISNDTTAVQNAINDLRDLGGGTLFFPKGTYRISTQLTLYSNITLCGYRYQSKLKFTNTVGYGISWNTQDNIHIRDLSISSTDDANSTTFGIIFHTSNNVTIENCEISYFNKGGIRTAGITTNTIIRNNHIHHIYTANMAVTPVGHVGIDPSHARDCLIEGNYVHDIGQSGGDWGIYDSGIDSNGVKIIGNTIKDCSGGIQVTPAGTMHKNYSIIGNQIINPKHSHVMALNQNIQNLVVSNNTVEYGTNIPGQVIIRKAYDFVVSGNTIKGDVAEVAYGYLDINGSRGVVANNHIFGKADSISSTGIGLGDSCNTDNVLVTGNNISNCARGVWLVSTVYTVSNVKILGNKFACDAGVRSQQAGVHMQGAVGISNIAMEENDFSTYYYVLWWYNPPTDVLFSRNRLFGVHTLLLPYGTTAARCRFYDNLAMDSGFTRLYHESFPPSATNDYLVLNTKRTSDGEVVTLANAAIPDIWMGNNFKTGGTTAITNMLKGFKGQTIRILAAHTVTIQHNANANPGYLLLKGAVDFAMTPGKTLTLHMFDQDAWREVARTD